MNTLYRFIGIVAIAMTLVWMGTAQAQDRPGEKSGTIDFHELQVAYIGSGTMGHGTLHFQGKEYKFDVGGLGIGGIGVSEVTGKGDVYGLENVDDFPGTYGEAQTGYALGNNNSGEMWLENPNGVSIHLKVEREGLSLSMGAGGLNIQMQE